MKIGYVSHINIPDDWGHSVQVMNMCHAFSLNNATVSLFVPNRDMPIKTDPFVYYGLPQTFTIQKLPCIDMDVGNAGKLAYYLRIISFYISVLFLVPTGEFDVIYSRDIYAPLFAKNVVLEIHSFPKRISLLQKIAFRRAKKIVVLTSFLKKKFEYIGVSPDNIFVSPDAVDVEKIDHVTGSVSRGQFGFKDTDFILGYVGALKTMGMDKGLNDTFLALKDLDTSYKCLIVGGWGDDLEYYKKRSQDLGITDKVFFTGKVPHKDVGEYMHVCDCLVAQFPFTEHYAYFMSPLKIFEYMASKRPIVSTTLPSILEVLKHNRDAVLVEPDNPVAIKHALEKLREDTTYAQTIAHQAYDEVSRLYTWTKRGANILDFIQQ